jgi:phospholipid/cholesterol/gamma-HCH transport system permease protein
MNQLFKIGYKSIPVTTITTFFTGMVMAYQIGRTMDALMAGSSVFVGSAVALSMFRELCPTLTALMLAGRVGSSIAAEIGTMQVTEQIDALKTLSANPIQYLAAPRFIACLVMTPLLTILGDMMGVFGGAFISYFGLGISIDQYFSNIIQYVRLADFFSGIIKSFFFGIIIAVIACYQGFATKGGAEGVGRATISAVVYSSMAILISNYFLTYLLSLVNL